AVSDARFGGEARLAARERAATPVGDRAALGADRVARRRHARFASFGDRVAGEPGAAGVAGELAAAPVRHLAAVAGARLLDAILALPVRTVADFARCARAAVETVATRVAHDAAAPARRRARAAAIDAGAERRI